MTFEELKPILEKVFPNEKVLLLDMKKSEISSWDSIENLNLILELEDSLGISFSKEEIENIDSIQSILDLINNKIR